MSTCFSGRKNPNTFSWSSTYESTAENGSIVENEDCNKSRVFGSYTNQLLGVFEKYANDSKLAKGNVASAFHDLNLFPSQSQVHEMVHCAVEYGSPCVANNITFGEFCVLIEELQHHYSKDQPLPCALSAIKMKSDGTERRKRKESQVNFQVFLGGSCNPTTWRNDIAIPFLKKKVITFYNPVNTWRPELIELEDRAKQSADLLCFVIDNQTRAVVSMIETAYLVGCQRQIIVVLKAYDDDEEVKIGGKPVSELEKSDIKRVRNVLIDIVERNSIPVFTDIKAALNCVVRCLEQGITVQELEIEHGAIPVRHGYFEAGQALLKLRETFNSITCDKEGKMSKKDVQLAYKCITGEILPTNWIQNHSHVSRFSFEDLCCLVTEYKKRKPSVVSSFFGRVISPITWIIGRFKSNPSQHSFIDDDGCRDIYLGGSYGKSTWREKIAIPLLRRHGLSYLNPIVNEWTYNLIPMQVAAREKCRLLLFVLTHDTRSFAAMVEAGYYIGKGCRVVLCVQHLKKDAIVYGEKLEESQVEDYNRGRMYLSDIASKEGIQIFDDLTDSINCAISLLKEPCKDQLS